MSSPHQDPEPLTPELVFHYDLLNCVVRKELVRSPLRRKKTRTRMVIMFLAGIALIVVLFTGSKASFAQGIPPSYSAGCDTVEHGYRCNPAVSHFWGQYSPYFSVNSTIPDELPDQCLITFAQVLSRHGARDPTTSKTQAYAQTIQKIHSKVKRYPDEYAFLANYNYTLGANQLTLFGEQEMINSGIKFFQRYRLLTAFFIPFVRASGEARVVESAENWTQGYHYAKVESKIAAWGDDYPYPILVISEDPGSNNTLNHGLCTAFEDGPDSSIASSAQSTWANIFIPPIQARLNAALQGADLSITDTINMMDLCPFNTVASPNGTISQFCSLFSRDEWHQYNYYETLNKYYGFSYGNPLGPTQGVGFTSELIARLTNQPVHAEASVNRTLDDNPATFPLGRRLYADFTHDNDITAILSAMGLYNDSILLPNTTIVEAADADGYSAAWTVPFAARTYFEKMYCLGQPEEQIRIIVNDRVLPLTQCGGDELGRCYLSAFIDSLSFARNDGDWGQCFASS